MQEIKIQKDAGGHKAPSVHGDTDASGATTETGEPQRSENITPSRGDRFLTIRKLNTSISAAEIADYTGSLPEIGGQADILKFCERLLPVVRNLPTWTEPKWNPQTVTVGQVMAHITMAVKLWKKTIWDNQFEPVCDICYGSPIVQYGTAKKPPVDRNIYVLWAYDTRQSAIMPSMAFLLPLKDLDRKLYNILCTVVGKLASVNSVQLWDNMTDNLDRLESYEDQPDDPDPHSSDNPDVDIANYWLGARPVLTFVRSQGRKTSMRKLQGMIRRYRWDANPTKTKTKKWIDLALEIIGTKKKLYDYCEGRMMWQEDSMAGHASEYIWFRWFGHEDDNFVECEIDNMMEAQFNEGGFYPFRKLFKYTTDQEFQQIQSDPFPKKFETMMVEGLWLFNSTYIKRLKK